MVRIAPFAALRPTQNNEEAVAALPYDVMSTPEAKEMVANNPKSFLRITRPEVNVDEALSGQSAHEMAKKQLQLFIDEGLLKQDEDKNLYLYRLTMNGQSQTGLVCCVQVKDYDDGIIKRHELTRPDKENDRADHVDIVNANTGPLFFTYQHQNSIDEIVNDKNNSSPDINFTAEDGIQHEIWVLDSQSRDRLLSAFESVPALYVADGHHRMAAASRVRKRRLSDSTTGEEEYNFALAVLFPDNQLNILDYNRIIFSLNGKSTADILESLKSVFDIEKTENKDTAKPQKEREFGMVLDQNWYRLKLKNNIPIPESPAEALDVALLQKHVLTPIFGIDNPRTSTNIAFIGGIRGLQELEKRCQTDAEVAFALFPTTIQQLIDVSDADELMPPKSTWFEPKLRSGLFLHVLD